MESINSQALHDQRQREIRSFVKNFAYSIYKEARGESRLPEHLADKIADKYMEHLERERGEDERIRAEMQKIILDNKLLFTGAEKLLIVDKDMQEIGERLRTQNNRGTQDPLFCLQVKKRDYGYEEGYTDLWCWFFDGEYHEDDSDEAKERTDEWDRVYYCERWSTVMVSLTEQACIDWRDSNKHHLHGESRVWAMSLWRCNEMIAIRKRLMEQPKLAPAEKGQDDGS